MFLIGRVLQLLGLPLLVVALYVGVAGDGSRETAMLQFAVLGLGTLVFLTGRRLAERPGR